jgi:hypothetical protein
MPRACYQSTISQRNNTFEGHEKFLKSSTCSLLAAHPNR